ncbi:hypothetical protein ECDEC14D_4223 [Escherichia coli DEC14D]|nr:hypothetical protein ECDEC10E_4669 [Escherichia coli DEC10E]EHX75589.1 hypothetical protein ECDEC14B_4361 [Escherichia coli DEC14B]EHX85230.1 hypothetical protein ECDEC14C_4271 [Escherichia coli DEC14C]EHX88540.1 hypothetical protein ECDEC14D_4223 [Escherichia coli DEC14D]
MAVDPQDVWLATQAFGVMPRLQENIPEGPGLIDRGEGHPPDGQPGNGDSIKYQRAEPVPLCILDLDRIPHRHNAMLRMVEKELGYRNVEMMLSW